MFVFQTERPAEIAHLLAGDRSAVVFHETFQNFRVRDFLQVPLEPDVRGSLEREMRTSAEFQTRKERVDVRNPLVDAFGLILGKNGV